MLKLTTGHGGKEMYLDIFVGGIGRSQVGVDVDFEPCTTIQLLKPSFGAYSCEPHALPVPRHRPQRISINCEIVHNFSPYKDITVSIMESDLDLAISDSYPVIDNRNIPQRQT